MQTIATTDDALPMTAAETFFYRFAKLFYEDDLACRSEAYGRAGAERLGFLAGVIFEWDTVYEDGFQLDRVSARIGNEVVLIESWFAELDDDSRRCAEADLILYRLVDRLLSEVGGA